MNKKWIRVVAACSIVWVIGCLSVGGEMAFAYKKSSTKAGTEKTQPNQSNHDKMIKDVFTLAQAGKVSGSEFGIGSTWNDITRKYGKPDFEQKGQILKYESRGLDFSFGVPRADRVSLIMSYDKQMRRVSIAELVKVMGDPVYVDTQEKINVQNLIYLAGEYTLQFAFPIATKKDPDPKMLYYCLIGQ